MPVQDKQKIELMCRPEGSFVCKKFYRTPLNGEKLREEQARGERWPALFIAGTSFGLMTFVFPRDTGIATGFSLFTNLAARDASSDRSRGWRHAEHKHTENERTAAEKLLHK